MEVLPLAGQRLAEFQALGQLVQGISTSRIARVTCEKSSGAWDLQPFLSEITKQL